MLEEVFAALNDALDRGEASALVTIVSTRGSTPQKVGAKLLVFADGRTVGTIGGGCYENDAFWKAREIIRTRRAEVVKYDLTDDLAEESGLICGGHMEVFIEPIEPAPQLYIAGAGHVALQLARFAHAVGFKVHVVDDREKFANRERFPEAAEVAVDSIAEWLARRVRPNAYVVIATRGHVHDLDALRAVAGKELRYVGLIGSRAKVKRLDDALLEESVSREWLRTLHSPIGLQIGAVTPEEIAISIVAELIAAKRGTLSHPEVGAMSMSWNKLGE
jgi:xanthine dehydrogenase accessory factor